MENTSASMSQCPSKKAHVVSFRLTDEQLARLKSSANNASRTLPDMARFICVSVTGGETPAPIKPKANKPRLTPTASSQELAKISGLLGNIGGNINQMARVANSQQQLPTAGSLAQLHQTITDMQSLVQRTLKGSDI